MTEREFELSRRDLLRFAAQGAALLGTGSLLAACSPGTRAGAPRPLRHDDTETPPRWDAAGRFERRQWSRHARPA